AGLDIAERFPTIRAQLLPYGVDITKDPIPVVPAAHYFCGGIKTDLWGQTDIPKCYAVGEVACTGLHGANRLASTSLLEGVVWGVRVARHIAETYDEQARLHFKHIRPWHSTGLEEADPALIHQDWSTIRTTMWNYAGIVRTARRLERALADLGYLHHRIEQFYRTAHLTDELVGLRTGILVALLVVQAALRNPLSRGCHFRKD
ncbi:MAG: FAD-binding protein, partial [Candidatus Tectimicrobiota bacterium]